MHPQISQISQIRIPSASSAKSVDINDLNQELLDRLEAYPTDACQDCRNFLQPARPLCHRHLQIDASTHPQALQACRSRDEGPFVPDARSLASPRSLPAPVAQTAGLMSSVHELISRDVIRTTFQSQRFARSSAFSAVCRLVSVLQHLARLLQIEFDRCRWNGSENSSPRKGASCSTASDGRWCCSPCSSPAASQSAEPMASTVPVTTSVVSP